MKKTFFSSMENSFFWGVLALVWQVLFFYVPLAFLLSTSFVMFMPSSHTSYFTLSHYVALLDPVYGIIFLRSLLLALGTVSATFIISYPVAYYLALRVQRLKTLWFALLIVPFWTNLLLLVYSWYFLLENDGLINSVLLTIGLISQPLRMMNTPFAVYCGMIYCYLPFMLLPLYTSLEKIDQRLLEASSDLGATSWQTFKNVVLPLTAPGIKTGVLLVFIPSFGEFVVPGLLGGDKNMYVGSVITHYFLSVRNVSQGSAFTCVSVLVLLMLLGLGATVVSKFKRQKGHRG